MTEWNIVWHYRDLRIHDNPALNAAASGKIIPLYIHSPQEEKKWKGGSASNWWLHHSLENLKKQYQEQGITLVIRSGNALDVLEEIFSEKPINCVYWNYRYEPNLGKRDKKIIAALNKQDVPVHQFEGNYLITPSQILNKTNKPYSVFTPFSRNLLENSEWRTPLSRPKMQGAHKLKSETIQSLKLLPKKGWAEEFSDYWTPGREGAMSKLKSFTPKVSKYTNNRDIPSICGTSHLSPHLHFGEISPHEIWKKLDYKEKKSMPFLRQLIWREFGNYFLYHSPEAADESWKIKFEEFDWNPNKKNLRAWQKGLTGYPIVDAGMRELWQTGWMHNRVRMIVGSFLVKHLRIHWIEGAKWFWDTLVDADLANNTLGWQWIAGCGPDAAPYFRIFNPILQGKKFDPKGEYIRRFVPELADVSNQWIHSPWESPDKISNYPSPIVDHSTAREEALASYQKIK